MELYKRSYLKSDQKEAFDIFERIAKRYPKSRYKQKANEAIRAVSGAADKKRTTRGERTAEKAAASSKEKEAKQKYGEARTCYQKLLKNPKRKKYRDIWKRCIKKFEAAYRHDPTGPWAAASLYMAGKLYKELYRYSYKTGDKNQALDFFESVVKHFPQSRYKQKADEAIRAVSDDRNKERTAQKERIVKKPTVSSKENESKKKYVEAEACYKKLLENPKKQKYRDNWQKCIGKFQTSYQHDPTGPWATASLYMAGKLNHELYGHSYKKSDRQNALDIFEDIVARYPDSQYHAKALDGVRKISPERARQMASTSDIPSSQTYSARVQKEKSTSVKGLETPDAEPPVGDTATVTGLRFWSNPRYTRVVIDADRETTYTHNLLKKDPTIHKPRRLFVDIDRSRLGKNIEKFIPIHDNLLSNVRAGQNTFDSVRVVIDIKSSETYKIFSLKNPFRVVIDVWGTVEKERPKPHVAKEGKVPPGSLTKQLALGVRRIVVDPGHGGKDYGAPGYLKGIHEKRIILSIAKRLAKKIRETIGCEVFLTRDRDKFLTLEERTAIANTKNADLFISLHANSSRDSRAYGIETYFLNLATDDHSIMVAARENATSTKNISDLQAILNDLMQNTKINESSRLAAHVQDSLYHHLKKRFRWIKNKGVKQAPFYVLLGAEMPAILIETSFISNRRECKRLTDATYQDQLCDGIVNGIRNYIKEINPTVFVKDASKG